MAGLLLLLVGGFIAVCVVCTIAKAGIGLGKFVWSIAPIVVGLTVCLLLMAALSGNGH